MSGGAISDNGDVLLWSRAEQRAWVAQTGDSVAVPIQLNPGTDVVGGSFVNASEIELVDALRREIISVSPIRPPQTIATIRYSIRAHAAARVGKSWLIGGEGLDGNPVVVMVSRNETMLLARPAIERESSTDIPADGFYMRTLSADAALLSWVKPPYRLAQVDTRGHVRWLPPIPDSLHRLFSRSEQGWNLWSGLAAFEVGRVEVVQTLADLGSTGRLLLIRNSEGHVVRHRSLDVPIGLVASSPSGQKVLGFTQIPSATALRYEASLR